MKAFVIIVFTSLIGVTLAYDGACNYRCDGCHGPKATDWDKCTTNASKNHSGICVCNLFWAGPDCSTFVGSCDAKCNGCNGPTALDCDYCVKHSTRDSGGYCVCEFGYTGESCGIAVSGSAQCDPKCNGCTGRGPKKCIACVTNATLNKFGECVCKPGWTGSYCTDYQKSERKCHPRCESCTGSSPFDCIDCVKHATKTNMGECICQSYWTGDDCSLYQPHTYSCNAKCMGSCTGPTAFDCISCVQHASKNQKGECVCDKRWEGEDCSDFSSSRCPSKCKTCTGPGANECLDCVTHASLDTKGYCNCDAYWAGDDCTKWLGPCSGKCDGGCNGPDASDCEYCAVNAYLNDHGLCECNTYWTGESCDAYKGPCDEKCYGCYGPGELDCKYCVPHAQFDGSGACVCEKYWQGEDCSTYNGVCDKKCTQDECHGPTAGDCDICVDNSTWDTYGYCICDTYWTGHSCEIYVGPCDGKCIGCDGPGADKCHRCAAHTHRDLDNFCICDEGWQGEDCIQYSRICDPKCEGCKGPTDKDCDMCIDKATFNGEHVCICDEYWEGNECSLYTGPCHQKCATCSGPFISDCLECQAHAYFDDTDTCACKLHWQGLDCSVWTGPCNPKCVICTGPTSKECDKCVAYAHWDSQNNCVCDEYWGGEDCSQFVGKCSSKCMQEFGCSGHDASHCNICTTHASWSENGVCQCDKHRSGSDCSIYTGHCNPICDECNGPDALDCMRCIENARWDQHQVCRCEPNWVGESCSVYTGECSQLCDSQICNGPLPEDCVNCIVHSHRQEGGCTCDKDWGGQDCSIYLGECDTRCKYCYGSTNAECYQCIPNAGHDNGKCLCEGSWAGDICTEWEGACDPICNRGCSGPGPEHCTECTEGAQYIYGRCRCNFEWTGPSCTVFAGACDPKCAENECFADGPLGCFSCVERSYRDSYGACVCEHAWGGWEQNCSIYIGECWHTCAGCTGPREYDCKTCFGNSRFVDGQCQCDENWDGHACMQYSGECHPMCLGCYGPGANECVLCIPNADEDMTGACVCEIGWVDPSCTTWSQDCFHHCKTCTGPEEFDCFECVAHAYKDEMGVCQCQEDWGETSCTYFKGECASVCDGCLGPAESNCEFCAENAEMINGTCICAPDWAGPHCSVFKGVCNPICDGCTGPTERDCVQCMHNSSEDTNDACVCGTMWEGPSCDSFVQEYCQQTCDPTVGCEGPTKTECKSCVTNAYRDEFGSCECDADWVGPTCAQYIGQCDSICEECTDGSRFCEDCVANAEFVESKYGASCQCQANWTGSDCTLWKGECSHRCIGCHGPSDLDCMKCVPHAHFVPAGTGHSDEFICQCQPGWQGENCQELQRACHISCGGSANCSSNDPDFCTKCPDGYTLSSGTCFKCASSCFTCSLHDGNHCESCHDGYFVKDGKCQQCSAKCKTCSGEATTCTSCFLNANLQADDCLCNRPHNRSPTTLKCEEICPTGFSKPMVAGTVCVEDDPNHPAVNFDLTANGPWTSGNVVADFCRLPFPVPERGIYFDGKSSMQLQNFYLHSSYTFGIWALVKQGNGILLNYEFALWEGWDEWTRDSYDDYFTKIYEHTRQNSLMATSCHTYRLQTDFNEGGTVHGGLKFSAAEWNYFQISETSDFSYSSKSMTLNREVLDLSSSDLLIAGPPNGQVFIGSFEGLIKFFNGFIYQFQYYTSANIGNQMGQCKNYCSQCPQTGCIPTCRYNQYISSTGICEECHPTCTHGCEDPKPCKSTQAACHHDCQTCTGPEEYECVTCWCGAQRLDTKARTSECVCPSTHTGTPINCTRSCFEGCEICRDNGPDDCVSCSDKYHLIANEVFLSAQGYCEYCYEELYDMYPTCGIKEWNDEIEECNCEPGQWFDEATNKCRHCSHHCMECAEAEDNGFHCKACENGYHFLRDSDICVKHCPTGQTFLNHGCDGDPTYVIDFWFVLDNQDVINREWSFEGSYVARTGKEIAWSVKMYGGEDSSNSNEIYDPYIIENRGLWFDGQEQYATIKNLTLSHDFTISSWIKPHGTGAIFSSSDLKEKSYKFNRSVYLSAMATSYQWADSYHNNNLDFHTVNLYEWQHISLMIGWDQKKQQSVVSFGLNGNLEDTTVNHITLDFPENNHVLGAMVKDDLKTSFYKGFIYMFRVYQGLVDDPTFGFEIQENCVPCEYCPANLGKCLGVCNWNYHWEETAQKCARCPYWCDKGCHSDGTC